MTRFVDPMQRRTPTSLMKCNRTTNQRAELPKSGGVWCGWVGVAVAVGQKSGVLADGRFERLIMSRAGLTPARDIINLSKRLPLWTAPKGVHPGACGGGSAESSSAEIAPVGLLACK